MIAQYTNSLAIAIANFWGHSIPESCFRDSLLGLVLISQKILHTPEDTNVATKFHIYSYSYYNEESCNNDTKLMKFMDD